MRTYITVFFLLFTTALQAQIGGERVFSFINLPSSSRASAAGGSLITVVDDDPGLAFQNPSLLNASMHNRFHASSVVFYSGINYGNFNYVRHYAGLGTFQTGLQYIAYGKFIQTDITGKASGEFRASEYSLNAGGAYTLGTYYTLGANLKFMLSQLESYYSFGAAVDFAASFYHPEKNITATLVIKNAGLQFKPYYGRHREPLPFEIQAGFSVRFKHLPFRLSITLHDLQNFQLRYDNPENENSNVFFGADTVQQRTTAGEVFDEIFRHFIIAGEVYIKKKVVILGFAYNHQRRQEMKTESKKGLAGFSVGIKINIRQFAFGYAPEWYHFTGPVHHISVGVSFNELIKKKPATSE
ncbi:MAG: hypothetical protein KatS3mg031_0428 [Chitinophagales bacterium]|nr:MAG: hypothetical protein KatS3mg031_0428 [Chitinophagales bacterium]